MKISVYGYQLRKAESLLRKVTSGDKLCRYVRIGVGDWQGRSPAIKSIGSGGALPSRAGEEGDIEFAAANAMAECRFRCRGRILAGAEPCHQEQGLGAVAQPYESVNSDKFFAVCGCVAEYSIVGMETKGDVLVITERGREWRIPLADVKPVEIKKPGEDSVEIKIAAETMAEILRKAKYAMAGDSEEKSNLAGVHIDIADGRLKAVATDGKRLAICEYEVGGVLAGAEPCHQEQTIPKAVMPILMEILKGEGSVRMRADGAMMEVETNEAAVVSKLIEEKYPNYERVIPEKVAHRADIDREEFLHALEAVSISGAEEARVSLSIAPGRMMLLSYTAEMQATAELPIKYAEGEDTVEITMNGRYIKEALAATDSKEISMGFTSGETPVQITCEVPYMAVIMPMRGF